MGVVLLMMYNASVDVRLLLSIAGMGAFYLVCLYVVGVIRKGAGQTRQRMPTTPTINLGWSPRIFFPRWLWFVAWVRRNPAVPGFAEEFQNVFWANGEHRVLTWMLLPVRVVCSGMYLAGVGFIVWFICPFVLIPFEHAWEASEGLRQQSAGQSWDTAQQAAVLGYRLIVLLCAWRVFTKLLASVFKVTTKKMDQISVPLFVLCGAGSLYFISQFTGPVVLSVFDTVGVGVILAWLITSVRFKLPAAQAAAPSRTGRDPTLPAEQVPFGCGAMFFTVFLVSVGMSILTPDLLASLLNGVVAVVRACFSEA